MRHSRRGADYTSRGRLRRRWHEQGSIYLRPVFAKQALFDRNGLPLISVKNDRVLVGLEVTFLDSMLSFAWSQYKGAGSWRDPTAPATEVRRVAIPKQSGSDSLRMEEAPPTFAGKTHYGYESPGGAGPHFGVEQTANRGDGTAREEAVPGGTAIGQRRTAFGDGLAICTPVFRDASSFAGRPVLIAKAQIKLARPRETAF